MRQVIQMAQQLPLMYMGSVALGILFLDIATTISASGNHPLANLVQQRSKTVDLL
jgi:hypothetical protein